MKPTKLFLVLAAAVLLGACTPKKQQSEDCLKHALETVERIKVAGYEIEEKVKAPYEKDWSSIRHNRFVEQDNPQDTTIGASALRYGEDGWIFSVYDGINLASFNHDEKRIVVEDFLDAKSQALPFRMYHPPFFSYVKSLIRYMLTTTDSINLDVEETDEDFIYKLSIYEDRQVEFFGRAYKMPENPFALSEEDAYSYYTLWIRKGDAMPYRYLREMSHNVQDVTCHHAEWSEEVTTSPIVATDLILLHGSYKVHYVGRRDMDKEARQHEQLIGKAAPEWTLKDMNGKSVALSSLRGKPTIINLTGLGCGPCAQAYPELVELSKRYNIVSIESWGKSAQSLRDYAAHHKISYPMLLGEDAVLNAYVGTNRGVPVFFYLDENHIIRKVDRGYAKGMISRSTEELGWE
ncbi:MAG: TlpA family protein disulfide reductase [Bacteroidaceae bacterium]|nr:TlpA family protein disulfide reductase [Bacteroidaceae bacterium]